MTTRHEIEARLDGLKRNRREMRLANRFLRSGNDDGLLAMGFTRSQIARLKVPDPKGCIGFAPVTLKNTVANIGRLRERLENLKEAR